MLYQDLFDSLPENYIDVKLFNAIIDAHLADALFPTLDEDTYNKYPLVFNALFKEDF